MRVEPKEIIKTFKENRDASKTGRVLGIHKSTVYRWLRRARSPYPYGAPKYKERGLKRRSTRPKHIHYVLSGEAKIKIEILRKQYGYTAKKLKKVGRLEVSVSTIERYLKRRGLAKEKPRHRRPLCQDTVHMHVKNATTVGYLQMDVKYLTPELTGLPWTCFEYAVNENAVIERSFRTDEEEFIFYKAPFSDYDDLRDKYASWLRWYNTERPHLGIDLKTPMEMIR